MKPLQTLLATLLVAGAAAPAVAASTRAPVPEARPGPLELAHAAALGSFRRARFSEAYGRFIKLAEAGHPASARYAIWMCENGSALFGVPWDCAPQELEDWGAVAARTFSRPGPLQPPQRLLDPAEARRGRAFSRP